MQSFAEINLSPPKMQGECSCSQVDATLCKNAHITCKNAGSGRQNPLAKLYHCPAKAAWGMRDASARISAMLFKDTLIPQKMVGGKDFVSHPHLHWMQTKPPQMQNCITRVCARALLLIAGFKPKKAGKKYKNMIFWRRGLLKTFSLPKIP